MLISQALLLVFMSYWLYNQYKTSRIDFQKAVIAQFDESQRKISDSLLLIYLAQSPIPTSFIANDITVSDSSLPRDNHQVRIVINDSAPGQHFEMRRMNLKNGQLRDSTFIINTEKTAGITDSLPPKLGANISLIINKLKGYTDSNQATLFHKDTVLFNKMFSQKMKENGWQFNLKWTKDSTTSLNNQKNIYIKSEYFTNSYGLEVSHFSWYLLKKISPQILFTLILLIITGLAFRLSYTSLKEQITLGTMKNDFISNMSHELKTPVSTIKVALEALDTYKVIEDRETAKEYLEMANTEVKRLDLLINQALNTSLLENGKVAFHKEKEDLQKLTSEVLEVLKMRFAQHRAAVIFNHKGSNFFSQVDKLHIQGVLINILDNSLKYAGENPSIAIDITELEKEIRITIGDSGPGIPVAYLDKIFEKFFRVPTGNEHSIKGYGLGLSYARQVMEQHGGSIKAANVQPGGTVFTLTFMKDMV